MPQMTLRALTDAAIVAAQTSVEPSAGAILDATVVAATVPHATAIVAGISHDSRTVGPSEMYCAIPGADFDGHDFAQAAVAAGASSLLVERQLDEIDVAQVVVPSTRRAMPWFASSLHGSPSSKVPVIGVTGTNGKTTTTHLLAGIVESAGETAQVIGTLSGAHTTPEAPLLQERLAASVVAKDRVVAIEVSSHALDQYRTDGTRFFAAVFTNLSRDHLDYHHTMDEYFAAKAVLFDGRALHSIVNVEDPYGARIAQTIAARSDSHGSGMMIEIRPSMIDIKRLDATGSAFAWRDQIIDLPLAGRFNIANAVAAAEAAALLGYDNKTISAGLSAAPRVPGRMDHVPGLPSEAPSVLVDYSHTPDSLEKALASAQELSAGRVIVVFGCGGDRDKTKRPVMGQVAAANADIAIVTSDNPRSEDPLEIIDQVVAGTTPTLTIEPDRRRAIHHALSLSNSDDVVLIAGKGHETTQTFADRVEPFDDRQVAADYYGAVTT